MVAISSVQLHSNAGNEQHNVKTICVFQKIMAKQSVLNNSPDIVMLWLVIKGKYTSLLPNHVHMFWTNSTRTPLPQPNTTSQ